MTITLYYDKISPPCRSVLMTANVLGIKLNKVEIALFKGEHLKPEFLKINPQHTLPTIDDDGFILSESRAIITYLADKYGNNELVYPKDPKSRSIVMQRLFFDSGTIYQRFSEAYYSLLFYGGELNEKGLQKLDESFELLNTFLSETKFVAGDNLTLADISLVASITTMLACDYDITKYTNVVAWLDKTKALLPDYDEANGEGIETFHQYYLKCINK